ncbi:pirin family protein [Streptomyces phaeoluteigriseus]|uniref:pirin family protein n=1 Tax=Streptomyces phaeoluteigriseus TaxID=114686 RepID=UPI003680343C
MIGAWALVDHHGPTTWPASPAWGSRRTPLICLRTVGRLHEGQVLHHDSTGSRRTIRPRELGLMTSGRAVSHSEESPRSTPAT